MRHFVSLLFALTAITGCSNSHGIHPDGSVPDAGGCPGYAPTCVTFCASDSGMPASCVDDRWECPEGWRPAESCECVGQGCFSDAGVDGGDVCSSAVEGAACTTEDEQCGGCTDPCGSCSFLRCQGGTWVRFEAHGPPMCTSFACGPELHCDRQVEYCAQVVSGVAGESDTYDCVPYPESCMSCDCLEGSSCEGDAETGITVTFYGA